MPEATKTNGRCRIVLTGGPGGGKTTAADLFRREIGERVVIVPEAATLLFSGGFPRVTEPMPKRAAQSAIYHLQRNLEDVQSARFPERILLCDRGTVDGAAYWPGPADTYWKAVGTTHEEELGRYAAVIHLRTPAANEGYNRDNVLRVESASEAQEIDLRILAAWEKHPSRFVVASHEDFLVKASQVLDLVRAQLPPCCRAHPLPNEKRAEVPDDE